MKIQTFFFLGGGGGEGSGWGGVRVYVTEKCNFEKIKKKLRGGGGGFGGSGGRVRGSGWM